MFRQFTILLLALMLSAVTVLAVAEETATFTEGVHYERLPTEQPTLDPDKIEVLELFWYGCPHCYELEPKLEDWRGTKPADVAFARLPAIPTTRWEFLAQVYFTAEVLGVLDKIHGPLFDAIHEEKRKLNNREEIAAIFESHGIPQKEFEKAWGSFAVANKLNRAKLMTRRYGITSVPTLIINGRYRTSGRLAGSHEAMLQVVDYLIAREEPQAQAAAPEGP